MVQKWFLVLLIFVVLVVAFLEPVKKDIPVVEVVEVGEIVEVVEIGWYGSTTNGKWKKVTGLDIPIYVFQSLPRK